MVKKRGTVGFPYTKVLVPIEVATGINRKGLARAGSWFMKSFIFYQIYLPAIDTIVTGMIYVAVSWQYW